MIDPHSDKIIFHAVNKKDGMLIQVSERFILDFLEACNDVEQRITTHSTSHDPQLDRIRSYRNQINIYITDLKK